MPAPDTSAYRMADRLADGELAGLLSDYRRVRLSWAAIARLLRDRHGIEVGPDTLKAWGDELGIEDPERVA